MDQPRNSKFHVVMFPWFAFGHIIPFLHLSNKLAEKGHTITFLLPRKAQSKIQHFNLYPNLITFHPLTVPIVEGLPVGVETASDVPDHLISLVIIAMDRTRDQVEAVINSTRPKIVFHDFSYWLTEITKPLSIKTINFMVVCAVITATATVPARNFLKGKPLIEADLAVPPAGYPSKTMVLHRHEALTLSFISRAVGKGISFYERITTIMKECDMIAIRTCHEMEGELCEYIASQYNKPVSLTGPVLLELAKTPLEERWAKWLDGFQPGSVVFCAFGSQHILEKNQFQELLLGFELVGLPFFIALKPPVGTSMVEEAFPDGYEERTKGRGVVWGGWIQQVAILDHPSVGCFVNHCGSGSVWESLMSDCQIVLVPPHRADFILQTRLLANELKVAVEVEKEENGWVSKENLCKAIKSAMDKDSKMGCMIKKNHTKWKETLVSPGFMSGYIDKFVYDIQELVT